MYLKRIICNQFSLLLLLFIHYNFIGNANSQEINKQKVNVLNYIEAYKFSEAKPTDIVNFRFPKLPELDSIQTKELFKYYKLDFEKTSRTITLVLLRYYRAHLKCCNQSFDLAVGQTEVDSLKEPLIYLYLNFSNQYTPENLFGGIGSGNPYTWVKKNHKWPSSKSIVREIIKIDKLEKKRWEYSLTELLKENKKSDKELIDRFVKEGKENGWKIPKVKPNGF